MENFELHKSFAGWDMRADVISLPENELIYPKCDEIDGILVYIPATRQRERDDWKIDDSRGPHFSRFNAVTDEVVRVFKLGSSLRLNV